MYLGNINETNQASELWLISDEAESVSSPSSGRVQFQATALAIALTESPLSAGPALLWQPQQNSTFQL